MSLFRSAVMVCSCYAARPQLRGSPRLAAACFVVQRELQSILRVVGPHLGLPEILIVAIRSSSRCVA